MKMSDGTEVALNQIVTIYPVSDTRRDRTSRIRDMDLVFTHTTGDPDDLYFIGSLNKETRFMASQNRARLNKAQKGKETLAFLKDFGKKVMEDRSALDDDVRWDRFLATGHAEEDDFLKLFEEDINTGKVEMSTLITVLHTTLLSGGGIVNEEERFIDISFSDTVIKKLLREDPRKQIGVLIASNRKGMVNALSYHHQRDASTHHFRLTAN